MLRLFSSFITTVKDKTTNDDNFFKMLWLSDRPEWVLETIEKMNLDPVKFFHCLVTITPFTITILRGLLAKYPQLYPSVIKIFNQKEYTASSHPLKIPDVAFLKAILAVAIGMEHSKFNKEYYHKLRVLLNMEMAVWRKFLVSCRNVDGIGIKEINDRYILSMPNFSDRKQGYILGLFNEPFSKTVSNPSMQGNEILSLYKGNIYKNKILRTPIELSLDIPLVQRDLHAFLPELPKTDEPLVIVTKNIGENVTPPKNMYVVFINESKSQHPNIFPYVENIALATFIDTLEIL